MKKHLRFLVPLLIWNFVGLKATAQNFSATYTFANVSTTPSPGTGTTDPTPPPTATGVTFGSFKAVGVSANPNASGRFSFTGWPLGATSGSNAFTGSLDQGRYYEVTVTPQTYYTINLTSIAFTVQRSATGVRQWAVRSSVDGFANNLPASIQPPNNALAVADDNKFQIVDRATTAAQDGSTITLTGFTNISGTVTFRFYGFNAEAAGGTFSLNKVVVNGTAVLSPTAPNISLSPTELVFPSTASGSSSVLSYTVQGTNLASPVTITAAAPYSISDALNGTYSSSLTLQVADVQSPKTVYVKFSPTSLGSFSGSITHASSSAITKTLPVSGQGIDASALAFDFNSCTNAGMPGSGFTTYSVTGPQVWACTTFGRNGTNGVNMNGYSSGAVDNDDWLISPALKISSLTTPVLRFWSRGEYSGPSLQLLISTDYSGSGDPNQATWTDLNAYFPPLTNTWALTDGINLAAYKAASNVYIAFRYTSSIDNGAARWTLDDIDVSDRSTLLTVIPNALNLGEASVNNYSGSLRFNLLSLGYGDLTVTAPSQFQVSTDSLTGFGSSVVVPVATAQAGTYLFARLAPTSKALNVQGQVRITGTGLDSNAVALSGTSYPKAETFDVGCYNLSFFGSTSNNNPTPEKIATQKANIATVLKRLNLDVVGVEEISNDTAFASLVNLLPNRKAVISDRWSYSFSPPDPTFPPQKTGFIYDSTTVQLVSARDMFVSLYDSVLNGYPEKLPNYPNNSPQSFWASGRLPFMATFNVTINGVTQQVRVIDIHAKSGADAASYARRVYDVKVLYDSLALYYPTDKIVLVGDYNDRVFGSINTGSASPYKPFVDNTADYSVLTYPLDQAGIVSFITGTGMIDHITVSNDLNPYVIPGSTAVEDPRSYISNYNANTASDHLPVFTRINFGSGAPLPVTLTSFDARPSGKDVTVIWTTATEFNNDYFLVERSANRSDFQAIGRIAGRNGSGSQQYRFLDQKALSGVSYYRLRQVDADGKSTLSKIVSVNLGNVRTTITLYPNPVTTSLQITSTGPVETVYSASIVGADGNVILKTKGTVSQLNKQFGSGMASLSKGVYLLRLDDGSEQYTQRFIRQ